MAAKKASVQTDADSADREAAELLTELGNHRRRIDEILRSVEDAYEHGHEEEADEQDELANALERMYPRVVAGLERYGHADRARVLETEWPTRVKAGLHRATYHQLDSGGFVDCPAWTLLSDAEGVLRDAVTREHTKYIREERRRAEDRAEAGKARRWQLVPAIITGLVAIVAVVVGNADKVATLVGRTPPSPRAVWHAGPLSTPSGDVMPPDFAVRCVPPIEGILAATGAGEWSLEVLPPAPRPLRLYCSASATGYVSNTVTVDVPDLAIEHDGGLPAINVGRATAAPVDGETRFAALDAGTRAQDGGTPVRIVDAGASARVGDAD